MSSPAPAQFTHNAEAINGEVGVNKDGADVWVRVWTWEEKSRRALACSCHRNALSSSTLTPRLFNEEHGVLWQHCYHNRRELALDMIALQGILSLGARHSNASNGAHAPVPVTVVKRLVEDDFNAAICKSARRGTGGMINNANDRSPRTRRCRFIRHKSRKKKLATIVLLKRKWQRHDELDNHFARPSAESD